MWYHSSPHDLPVGTILTPGGGDSPYGNGYETRGDHVWIDTSPEAWAFPESFIYEVQPSQKPQPWTNPESDAIGVEGYIVPSATITKVVRMKPDFNFITNRIATGGEPLHNDAEQLVAAGVNIFVDARSERHVASFGGGTNIHYCWNPTPDDGQLKPVEYWQRTLSFVMPLLAQPNTKAYFYCVLGINRGPSNALCVLVAQGLKPSHAERLIRTARPQVELAYAADAIAACHTLGYT